MTALDTLNAAGADLASWVGWMNLWTGLLLLAAVASNRLLSARVGARFRLLPFAAIALRLLLPVDWTSGVGMVTTELQPTSARVARPAVAPLPISASGAPPAPRVTAGGLALAVYVAGVAALLALWVRRRQHLDRALADANPARADLDRLLPDVPLLEHPTLGPLVVGLGRARVVLPSHLVDRLPSDAMRWVLHHERAHIAARDPALLGLSQLLAIAAWPVLPVWPALRHVQRLIEAACDEVVLERASPDERKSYGETLIAVADLTSTTRHLVAAAPGFGAGDLESRLRALTETARFGRPAQALLTVGIATIALLLAGPGATATGEVSAPGVDLVELEVGLYESDVLTDRYVAGTSALITTDTYRLYLAGRERPRMTEDSSWTLRSAPRITTMNGVDASISTRADDDTQAFSLNLRPEALIDGVELAFELTIGDRETSGTGIFVPRGERAIIVTEPSSNVPGYVIEIEPRVLAAPMSLDLENVPLDDVLARFSDISGLKIAHEGGSAHTVTVRLVGLPWHDALEVVLANEGLTYSRDGARLVVVPRAPVASGGPDVGPPISIEIRDLPIRDVLRQLAEVSRRNVIYRPVVPSPKNVTLRLVDTSWRRALDLVMRSTGLTAHIDGNIIYVGGEAEMRAMAEDAEPAP